LLLTRDVNETLIHKTDTRPKRSILFKLSDTKSRRRRLGLGLISRVERTEVEPSVAECS